MKAVKKTRTSSRKSTGTATLVDALPPPLRPPHCPLCTPLGGPIDRGRQAAAPRWQVSHTVFLFCHWSPVNSHALCKWPTILSCLSLLPASARAQMPLPSHKHPPPPPPPNIPQLLPSVSVRWPWGQSRSACSEDQYPTPQQNNTSPALSAKKIQTRQNGQIAEEYQLFKARGHTCQVVIGMCCRDALLSGPDAGRRFLLVCTVIVTITQ